MDIKKRLEALDSLVSDVLNMDHHQRLLLYGTAKAILQDIETYVEEHQPENLGKGSAPEYIAELYYPLETLTGIEDNGHDLVQNLAWFMIGLDKLRSVHCFDIQ